MIEAALVAIALKRRSAGARLVGVGNAHVALALLRPVTKPPTPPPSRSQTAR